MRYVFIVGMVLSLVACNNADKTSTPATADTATSATAELPSIDAFADSMRSLNKVEPRGITTAAGYFNRLVPADTLLADSAAVVFMNFVNKIVDTVYNRLGNDTTDYSPLVYPGFGAITAAHKAFKQRLNAGHILVEPDGEGGILVVPDYGWIRKSISKQTSAAVGDYLALLQREAINPTMIDAAVAIEMRELVERAMIAERLQSRLLPRTFAMSLADYSRFYTSTLLYGGDNTPALEDDAFNLALTPDFKQGYDYVLGTYPTSALAKQVRSWMKMVNANDTTGVRARLQSARY